MEIMTADGIRIFCLPDNAICKRMNTSPERFGECPMCNFDDVGYICVPELCDEYTEECET